MRENNLTPEGINKNPALKPLRDVLMSYKDFYTAFEETKSDFAVKPLLELSGLFDPKEITHRAYRSFFHVLDMAEAAAKEVSATRTAQSAATELEQLAWAAPDLIPNQLRGLFKNFGIDLAGGGTVRQQLLSSPSYHQGTGYVSQTGPAFLAQGEIVVPPNPMQGFQAGGLVGARESIIDTEAIQAAVQAGIEAGLSMMPTSLSLEGVEDGMLKLDASGLNAANRALGAEVFKLQEKSSSVEIRIEDIYNRLNNMATDTPEDEDSRQMVETLKHELDLLVEDLRIDMEEHSNSVITDVHQASTKFATMQSNIDAFENRIIALEGRLNSAQGQLDASFAKSLVNI
jgi:hypothetical protein